MTVDITTVFVVFGIVCAVVAVVVVGFKLSEKVEASRREAAADSKRLADEGYPFLPEFLECYAFRDRTGEFAVIRDAIKAVRDPDKRIELRDKFLRRQLELACQDGDRLKKLADIVAKYAPAVSAINAAVAAVVPVTAPVTVPVAAAASVASKVVA
jgi:hypothetical protein